MLIENVSHGSSILDNIFPIFLKGRVKCFFKSNSLSSNNVFQWTTLQTREDRRIQFLSDIFIISQNQTTTRTTKCLVSCCSGHMCIRNWTWMMTRGYKTSNVSHIYHEVSTYSISNFTEFSKINDT